ncbi:hypothetical protein IWW34DRAFT_735581 [Fusarium oxysporum f. sp. albedinis]|nr:hypothetical protein IWW34DRAFT_735581 [Fusarium oxysporum f. sp. albedinis]KAJ0130844.1 Retrovirus-related Pol polyprotein from transposon TNT 1-94 [Fusarium oxysporum f. sp. albedinis]KAK2468540.1 hypothetical protein H9L39_20186 [Fusarium oxysporum f. sp. albedinis]
MSLSQDQAYLYSHYSTTPSDMPGTPTLVLGATGPAGICVLRELLHRGHPTIAFVRSPSKVPRELASNPLLEIIKGELSDTTALSQAVAKSQAIISLLGPNSTSVPDPTIYASFYDVLFGLMRQHRVRCILAMGTISSALPQDTFSFMRALVIVFLRLFAATAYRSTLAIGEKFQTAAGDDLEWTVFRIFSVTGGADEAAWKADRGGRVFAGYVGEPGWNTSLKRGALARWLVDGVEKGVGKWVGKLPLVSSYNSK